MPLVRVSLQQGKSPEEKKTIATSIYEAMRETINIPENDRFVIFNEGASWDVDVDSTFMGMNRDAGAMVVEITLRKGRSREMKQALYRRIAERLKESAGVDGKNIMIVLRENESEDWSFGNGVAQYVV